MRAADRLFFATRHHLPVAIIALFVFPIACSPDGLKLANLESCDRPLALEITIEAGTYSVGSDSAYLEEAPVRTVRVGTFSIDTTEVTNRQFSQFVAATNYVTIAERPPELDDLPANVPDDFRQPGSAVFSEPTLRRPNWWSYVPGANWRHPEGPDSHIRERSDHPVVQIALEDAQSYAKWAGRRLPSEAEWEIAARGGLLGARYEWGDIPPGEGPHRANIWQGAFPLQDSGDDGFAGTAPVGCYPSNGLGLHDMTGNVWEWTETHYSEVESSSNLQIYTVKGGSFLCAKSYCRRCRPLCQTGAGSGAAYQPHRL